MDVEITQKENFKWNGNFKCLHVSKTSITSQQIYSLYADILLD